MTFKSKHHCKTLWDSFVPCQPSIKPPVTNSQTLPHWCHKTGIFKWAISLMNRIFSPLFQCNSSSAINWKTVTQCFSKGLMSDRNLARRSRHSSRSRRSWTKNFTQLDHYPKVEVQVNSSTAELGGDGQQSTSCEVGEAAVLRLQELKVVLAELVRRRAPNPKRAIKWFPWEISQIYHYKTRNVSFS